MRSLSSSLTDIESRDGLALLPAGSEITCKKRVSASNYLRLEELP